MLFKLVLQTGFEEEEDKGNENDKLAEFVDVLIWEEDCKDEAVEAVEAAEVVKGATYPTDFLEAATFKLRDKLNICFSFFLLLLLLGK